MKKTLIALSVLVAAGSVNAATVYSNDGFSADVFGDMEALYKQEVGANKEAKFGIDDADFGFKANSVVSDDLSVFGEASFNGNEASQSDGVQIDNAYVGVKLSNGLTVTFGRVVNYTDDLGNSTDQEIGGFYTANAGLATKTDQVMKLMYDAGDMFYAGFAVTGAEDGDDTTDDDTQFDIKAGVRFEGGEARAFYGSQETAAGADNDYMALEVDYSIDALSLGVHYSKADAAGVDSDALGVAVAYSMDKTTVSVGYSTQDVDGAASTAADAQWYANASYALGTNTSVYAEIADDNATGSDMGYAAGLRLSF